MFITYIETCGVSTGDTRVLIGKNDAVGGLRGSWALEMKNNKKMNDQQSTMKDI